MGGSAMQPFDVHEGIAAPLLRDNVDTDAIMPSREMNRVSKTGLADGLFAAWRYGDAREPRAEFVLNQPRYRAATVLIGGNNFGCGSSREFAVWALVDFGIRAIIAPGFGTIFHGNCLSNGVLPVSLPMATCQALAEHAARHPLRISLIDCTVVCGPVSESFQIEHGARERLMRGLDDIDMTLRHVDALTAFLKRDRQARPWAHLAHTDKFWKKDV